MSVYAYLLLYTDSDLIDQGIEKKMSEKKKSNEN